MSELEQYMMEHEDEADIGEALLNISDLEDELSILEDVNEYYGGDLD